MPLRLKKIYLERILKRYLKSTKKQKKLILNEFCAVSGYSRKYAIRILNSKKRPKLLKPGRKPKYSHPQFKHHLYELWKLTGFINSKSLKAAIPLWIDFYKDPKPEIKKLLLSASASTIERTLKPYKSKTKRGISSTRPSLLKNRIPLKLLDQDVKTPGFVEVDTVAHCGESLSGNFISTLTMTDLYSGWTENRGLWTKKSEQVVKQIKRIESGLPFELCGVASDNGSEFLNENLLNYLKNRVAPINFVRRRPYKKNDNAHVEQKNFTHVRKLLGYERIDDQKAVGMINEIYQAYFNPLQNFFIPSVKLIKKERLNSQVVKTYDVAQTPYQRLLDSPHVPDSKKKNLRQKHSQKNPVILAQGLEKKLKELRRYLDSKKADFKSSLVKAADS